jgi:hypothetical protein
LGRSATLQVEKEPRTNQDMVDDLHALLVNANIPAPYILGRLPCRATTPCCTPTSIPRRWPVQSFDAMHPDYYPRMLALVPEADKSDFGDYWSDPTMVPEQWDMLASADQLRALGSLGALPLVVLTLDHGSDVPGPVALPADGWRGDYYVPMAARLGELWAKCPGDQAAQNIRDG